jgi:septal ring factor EnvC (AmiA/AmiB activator)
VISRLERLLVKKGERVDEHDDIGIMGETAMLLSDGMYLEIRHKNETLDPLVWLDTRQLRQP